MLNVEGRCTEMLSGTLSDSEQYLPVNSEVLKKSTQIINLVITGTVTTSDGQYFKT
jgi:hypothetical protein